MIISVEIIDIYNYAVLAMVIGICLGGKLGNFSVESCLVVQENPHNFFCLSRPEDNRGLMLTRLENWISSSILFHFIICSSLCYFGFEVELVGLLGIALMRRI